MNISTGYAPSEAMAGSYPRSSYYDHHRYYAGAGASGSPIPQQYNTMFPSDGTAVPADRQSHRAPQLQGDPTATERGFCSPEAYGEENATFFPPSLHAGGSYPHPRVPYPGGTSTGYGYSRHPGALRMNPELSMYGRSFGASMQWYQHHPHHHHHPQLGQQHPHQAHHYPPATPRGYPLPSEHMCSMFSFNRNGREARNRAEKNRRDKLNGSIQELSAMVPHVAESPRRVDKTAVLRFSAHGLRVDYVFGKSKPEETFKPEAQDSLFRMLNGFLLTVTCRGQIVLVSPSVEQFLGHCQTDMYGQNLFNLTHPDDHALLKQQLVPANLVNLFDGASSPGSGTASAPSGGGGNSSAVALLGCQTDANSYNGEEGRDGSDTQRSQHDDEEEIDRKLRQDSRKFTIRMARAGPRSESTTYELVTIDGCFRRADAAPRGTAKPTGGTSGLQMVRRVRGRDDTIPLHSINGNDIVLIGLARVMKVPSICDRLIEACKYEYKTRHLIDGRIVQCDQRISIVAGYLTDEVSGVSPFTFMHRDDVRWVIVALRQMYDYNQNGESCYRLMSRTGDFIYLKTRGYLEVDSDTKVVQSFVCINTLVSEEEGQRLVREMKRKFSVIVDKVELPDESGEPVVENPKQIEEAVMNLITNLQPDGEDKLLTTMPASPASSVKSGYGDGLSLAIVAPEKSSIKSAIVKSINVVSIASKAIREARSSPGDWSPMTGDQQSSNESSSTSGTAGGVSPGGATTEEPMSPSQVITQSPVNRTPPPTSFATAALPQRPTVLQKLGSISPQPSGSGGTSHVEQRVPPLPNSDHYFTQPFSPSGGSGGTVPMSVLSPASSSQYGQRNARSPHAGSYTGSSSVPSPPATTFSRTVEGGGQSRTTSVLKRTYSNSSISSLNSPDTFGELNGVNGSTGESKRCKTGSPDLASCFNELMNPASDLTSFLPHSLEVLDQSLLTMETTTTIIRERVSNYPNLHQSQNQLERIAEEHQEQREILQSIQEEFHMQMQTNGLGNRSRQPERPGAGGGNADLVASATTTTTTASHPLASPQPEQGVIFRNSSPHTTHVRTSTVTSVMPSVLPPNVVRTPSHGAEQDAGS